MVQRRVILSTILTIGIAALTFNFWLIFKPLTFGMDISSYMPDKIFVTTELNRKDDDSFSKSYEEGYEINLADNNHYEVSFRHKTPPKRMRLKISGARQNAQYRISNLSFRGGKYPIGDFSKFIADGAKTEIQDGTLVIIPQNKNVTLTYKDKINARGSIKFDLKMFLIITILSYLLFYKLTSYLADFKINKNASRLDIIFLAICTVLLFIPISHISNENFSKTENRKLNKYKPLFKKDKTLNLNYGKDYESWISDRFALRETLVDMYRSFQYYSSARYFITPKAYLDKKTNWEFNNGQLNMREMTQDETKRSIDGINSLNNFCKSNGIKLYVLIVPNKADIYRDKTYVSISSNKHEYISEISKKSNAKVIYPYEQLKAASDKDFVYFKPDHHWTDYGAYIGYKELMKEIIKDFPQIKELSKDDFNIKQNKFIRSDWKRKFYVGHTSAYMLKLNDKIANEILDTQYDYYTHKNSKDMKFNIIDIPKLREKDWEYPFGANLKALMIGTSMNENLSEILPYTFNNTRYLRLNDVKDVRGEDEFKILKRLKQNILEYKPDIMVLCITVENLPALDKLTNEG